MKKKLKRRQGDEGKERSSRENKKLKRRQGVEVKRRRSREEIPSQEDENVRPHDLEFIHPTSQNQT
jgi:hypothetical protein